MELVGKSLSPFRLRPPRASGPLRGIARVTNAAPKRAVARAVAELQRLLGPAGSARSLQSLAPLLHCRAPVRVAWTVGGRAFHTFATAPPTPFAPAAPTRTRYTMN